MTDQSHKHNPKRAMANLAASDWEQIHEDFMSSSLTLEQLCKKHKVSAQKLSQYRKAHNWPQRPSVKQRAKQIAKPRQKPKRATPKKRRQRMIDRFYGLLEDELRLFENRNEGVCQAPEAPMTSVEADRNARTLSSLIRTYEKLIEFDDRTATKQAQTSDAEALTEKARDAHDEANRLRQQITQRLERLLESENTKGLPGGPER